MADMTIVVDEASSNHYAGHGHGNSSVTGSVLNMRNGFEKRINHVIFPDNVWIKTWDKVILVLLFGLAFIIPYQIGVSGGIYLMKSMGWFIINIIINTMFFVDTFLYFWRAYRRPSDGCLIFNLREIRGHYLRTMFVPNLLGNLPTTLIFYFAVRNLYRRKEGACAGFESFNFVILIKMIDALKFIRFARVGTIVGSSDAITEIVERHNSQYLELVKFTFLIVVMSHWFACAWSCVAFVEAGTFCRDDLLERPNWIGHWYVGEYHDGGSSDGGLDPLGWGQDTDRYALSLFWAVQTITSIGYGNITPLTPAEWWIGSVLQLCAGITWAYVIGGLVGVATALQVKKELYRTRVDDANEMIEHFQVDGQRPRRLLYSQRAKETYNDDEEIRHECKDVARRIKKYIHHQKNLSNNSEFANSLDHTYPILGTLTPELRQLSAFLLVRGDLERVNYLSKEYLTTDEQSQVATECILLEFSAGENVSMTNGADGTGIGRGVYVLQRGSAYAYRKFPTKDQRDIRLLTAGMVFGDDKVLTEDGCQASKGAMSFLSFSKVLFIPRQAILATLEGNMRAWKECGRWRYLCAMIRDQGDVTKKNASKSILE